MSKAIKLTFGYNGTDFTRQYKIANVADEYAVASDVKTKVKAVNASLAGGTAGGLDTFFLADDYDATENIGTFKGITAAQIDESETIHINIEAAEEGEGE